MSISKIAGRIAETPFSASFEKKGTQPAKFSLELDEADAEEMQRILTPTLAREGPGFLARTLRLRGAPPVPAWLKARKAEGTISIASATAGEWKGREVKARVQWDGTAAHFTNITAQLDSGAATGTMDVDLATPVAKYHLEGSVNSVAYHGGSLDLTGTVDAEGIGDALLSSAHAEGTVRGRNIAFAQDADFRTFSAAFTMQPLGTAPRWKLTNVEANALQGTGATLEDGRLQLDLGSARYTGTLFAPKFIENKLKFFPHINEAVAFGDGRDFVTALVNIDMTAVGDWAERRNIAYASYQELAAHPAVGDLIQGEIQQVNADLAADPRMAGAQIRRFLILHKALDADDGELTRTNKVRRGFIGDRYRTLIDALYSTAQEAFIKVDVTFEDGRKGTIEGTMTIRDLDSRPAAPLRKAG